MRSRATFSSYDVPFSALFWICLHKLSLSILKRLLVSNERLVIISPDGSRISLGDAANAPGLRFNSYSSLPRILISPWYAVGSHYVDGLWDAEDGRVADVLSVLLRCGSRLEKKSAIGRMIFALRRARFVYRQRYGISRSLENVKRHYDFGNDLFESFLDSKLSYTCADFEQGASGIDEAQETKMRGALARLDLKPGHRLLEIGCGWGALSRLASKEYGAKVTALSLSKNQLEYCRSIADEISVGARPIYRCEDYREHEIGSSALYDRIVSVGMVEHVGLRQLETYFSEVHRLLKPDGITLVHTIARQQVGVTNPWIDRHIFPGGYIAQDREIVEAAKACGFVCKQVHRYGAGNYIQTLRHWAVRFTHSWPVVLKYKYPECVRRTYDFYFAASEAAFRELDMQAVQFVFAKKVS